MLRIVSTILTLTLTTSASAELLQGKDASAIFLKGEIIGQDGREYLIAYQKDLYLCTAFSVGDRLAVVCRGVE